MDQSKFAVSSSYDFAVEFFAQRRVAHRYPILAPSDCSRLQDDHGASLSFRGGDREIDVPHTQPASFRLQAIMQNDSVLATATKPDFHLAKNGQVSRLQLRALSGPLPWPRSRPHNAVQACLPALQYLISSPVNMPSSRTHSPRASSCSTRRFSIRSIPKPTITMSGLSLGWFVKSKI